ncbi:MAG: ATP-dependent Clp protease adapter ClpS [Proteobacteria bacterium]|nr:ATP-dependent Clp protease adapter ClpS [Pseudomonadota bacterium]NDC23868.1 ATP-dependent Clp protease adapter ClpS [Pseudomonadota bacterium]NDD03320.1 ATP-dependent Clp protease adapter ClpS [Pseudomonadota bacterium]NDG26053.1 ATP-dependent Clp protease adapter ClpS [Pseudomonadota bacterium]
MAKHFEESGTTQTLLRPENQTKTPSLYKVVILNDDFTPQDYVVHILEKFFHKTSQEAQDLMLQVHRKGMGIAGIYTLELAETKTAQVNDYSKSHQYPLKCVIEKA